METVKKIIAKTAFYTILLAVVLISFFAGVAAANLTVDYFELKNMWCLIGFFPLLFVSSFVCYFFTLGLKEFSKDNLIEY